MRYLHVSRPLLAGALLACAASLAAADPSGAAPTHQPNESTARELRSALAALTAQQTTRRLGDGCWVRFYENSNFRGRSITVVGPVDLARLNVRGVPWGDWDSAVVGPQANVTTYGKDGFRIPLTTVGPGQRKADLQGLPTAQIGSIKVDCVT